MRNFNFGQAPDSVGQNHLGLIRTAVLVSADIGHEALSGLLVHPAGTALLIGFVSPHCDFADVAAKVRACVPAETVLLLVSSAGELCDQMGVSPYCPTGGTWDRVVLTSYSRDLFSDVSIFSFPLPNEDIRQGLNVMSNDVRIARLLDELQQVVPPFACDYHDTFVLTFVDGLSNGEPHLLEAIYKSNRFPLYFVGGAAGGKLDFKNTYLFDGTDVLENHAVLCFIKLAPGMRYSIFKTQNFKRTETAFVIADADPELRIVRSVAEPSGLQPIPFMDAVAKSLNCAPLDLNDRLAGMTFGVDLGGDLYVRSIAALHAADGSASFYCDVDIGDCLYLLEPTDFALTTAEDLATFLKGKPKPLGALLNDCILRRLNNMDHLDKVDAFHPIPLAGFSTFGEMFGLNINQTLTAVVFFSEQEKFADDLIDRFPIYYASFCSFFDRRAANRMKVLDGMRRQLRREHEFSQALISSLPGIFLLIDTSGKLVLWNENMESSIDHPPDDLLGLQASTLFHASDRRAVEECTARALFIGHATVEARLNSGKGYVPYYITAHAISLDDTRYLAGIGIDIADRKYFETALETSRKRLKMITDSLSEGVIVVNTSGAIVFANPSVSRLLECSELGDLEGHSIDSVFQLVDLTSGRIKNVEWSRTVTENINLKDDDSLVLTSTGKKRPIAYACVPLTDGSGKRTAVISFRDIEALKEAQRDMIQASKLASVGQLAAGIAHEINTPVQYISNNLNFIKGSMTTLLDAVTAMRTGTELSSADHKQLDFLQEEIPLSIDESSDGIAQIARIVLSMKEFSHPGSKSKTMSDLNRALESTLTVSHNVWKHVANVVKDFDPALPEVLCHAGELNQVFLNLIVNAAHAIEGSGKPLPGTITISTRQIEESVEIRVADSGTGIPDAILDRIYDPFFTTKGVGKGTGQGLAICRDVVVTKHGGRLDVGGGEGQGAIFIVRLPVRGADSDSGDVKEW